LRIAHRRTPERDAYEVPHGVDSNLGIVCARLDREVTTADGWIEPVAGEQWQVLEPIWQLAVQAEARLALVVQEHSAAETDSYREVGGR